MAGLGGRVAMVTGGSGGIGRATLRRFVSEGAAVVCADIDEERGATSSVYGLVASPGNAPYCTAKAGLINLTRTAAVEYGRKNIRVNAICPGVVETQMFDQVLAWA